MGNPFGNPQSCAGTQPTLPAQCPCTDPGVVLTGQDILVVDQNICPRRLLPLRDGSGNVIGAFVTYGGTGQQEVVSVTNQPSVPVPAVVVAANQSFGALLLCNGTAGLFQRVTPPATANLYIQTDGAGALKLAAPPSPTVPDPLSIGTLNLATALNVNGVTNLNGVVNGAGIVGGTIVNLLGLSSGNEVVKGTVSLTSKGWYFESASRTSTSFPNATALNGALLTIGNRLYDADGILSITSGTTIALTVGGTYEVRWSAVVDGNKMAAGAKQQVGVGLLVNGTLVNPGTRGCFAQGTGTNPVSQTVSGTHIYVGNVNDTLQLQANSPSIAGDPAGNGALGLIDVEMVVTKFK